MHQNTQSGKPSKGGSTGKPKATRTSKATKPAPVLGSLSLKGDPCVTLSQLRRALLMLGFHPENLPQLSTGESLSCVASVDLVTQAGDGWRTIYHVDWFLSLVNDNAEFSSPKTKS